MESILILSIVAMATGVLGFTLKISRYVYLCLKANRHVVIESPSDEANDVTAYQPLETGNSPTPKRKHNHKHSRHHNPS